MKTLYLHKYGSNFATRDFARLIFDDLIANNNYNNISLRNVNFTSRSFIDELLLRAKKINIDVVDIPRNLQPLSDIVSKSQNDKVVYAPRLKIEKTRVLSI